MLTDPDEGGNTSPDPLCDSFSISLQKLRPLAKLNGDSHEDLADVQAYISVLITILRKPNGYRNNAGLGSAFRSCIRSLTLLDELIEAYSPAETEATRASEHFTPSEKYRESLAQSKDALADAFNALRLTIAFGSSTNAGSDEAAGASLITTLKEGLDRLAQDTHKAAHTIFPPAHVAWSSQRKCVVRERELFTSDIRSINSEDYTVCPSATFLYEAAFGRRRSILKFECCCENGKEPHDGQLHYMLMPTSLPVEIISPRKTREWRINLYKRVSRAVVDVSISNVVPTYADRIERLWQDLAPQFARNHRMRLADPNATFFESLMVQEMPDAALARAAWCDGDFNSLRNGMSWSIYINQPPVEVRPDERVEFLQVFHFASTSRLDPRNFSVGGSGLLLQDHVLLVVSIQTGHSRKMTPEGTYHIPIFRYSRIYHNENQLEPFSVMLFDVGPIRQQGCKYDCSKVAFRFSTVHDAKRFAAYLNAMRQRLLQTWARGSFYEDETIYLQQYGALHSGSKAPKVKISIATSRHPPRELPELRLVVSREGVSSEGDASYVCLTSTGSVWDICKQRLPESADSFGIWVFDYDASGIPAAYQVSWNKLVSRGTEQKQMDGPPTIGGPQALREKAPSSDDWFNDLDSLKIAMKTSDEVKGVYERVKVCVVDTGFDPGDSNAVRIKGYKDFVDANANTNVMCDKTMHGTMSANIILSIYDDCVLYVARVFETNSADETKGPELMAEAVEWAIDPERDVDIISISAGFLHHSTVLQNAVQKASARGKLVFAAASNWGNMGPVAFPARHELFAICIFATNTLNKPSLFNPERRPDTSRNFALLGEDYPHPVDPADRQSGTSMATAAAAGLASLIIDFSRHSDNGSRPTEAGTRPIVRVQDVSTMVGMVAIFNFMSNEVQGFRCVLPKALLPAKHCSMSRKEQRAYVRDSISRAMDRAN